MIPPEFDYANRQRRLREKQNRENRIVKRVMIIIGIAIAIIGIITWIIIVNE